VINLELPWTPLRLEQRIGRVERIGQSRRVHAVHLLAAGTAEESYVAKLLTRTDRATEVTEKLRDRPPSLESIRAMAEAETRRIERLRRFPGSPGVILPDGRPPLTIRRKRYGTSMNLWGFHLAFADSTTQRVWQTLIGANFRDSRFGVRDSIDEVVATLAAALDTDRERARAAVEASVRAVSNRAAIREHAIARAIESERARLSVTLLQRGLFDRRAERALGAQTAVLDEALARCRARLLEIESSGQIVAEPARLAFALLRR
jgi:hypothetical protein